jgi:hypothetical protein
VEPGPPSTPLAGAALARRLSLDLRGVVPTLDELDRADAGEVDALLDTFLQDPRLEDRLVDLYGEHWLTRVDRFLLDGEVFGYRGADDIAFRQALGEEPLRIVARVVADDRPWAEVVTGDTTMVEETLAGVWPVDYPEGASGWQEVRYTDERPPLGVLASSALWWRDQTSVGNRNRHRAAAITDLLLCASYLARPVVVSALDPSLGDDVEDLIHTSPSCLGCHASLDPLTAELLWRRDADLDDFPTLAAIEAELRPGGFTGHALLRAIVASDDYRAGALTADATPADAERIRTRRMMTDTLFASAVADLTGFVWTSGGVPLWRDDEQGYRVLAGGVDGLTVTRPLAEPALTRTLAIERLAEAAASFTVARTAAGEAGLISAEALASAPGDPTFVSTLTDLHRRLYGEVPDADRLAADAALWRTVADADGEAAAWTALLAVLLRDPAFGVY